jgi:hypothetical protein
LPKLHSWLFHIDETIRQFGSLNGMTTETYEALHKSYVKNNYKRTNKRNFDPQILSIVSHILIINKIVIFHHFVSSFIYLFFNNRYIENIFLIK